MTGLAIETDCLFSGELSVDAVYNDGTSDSEVRVILDDGGGGTGRKDQRVFCLVPVSDLPSPEYQQTVTVDGVAWSIDQHKGVSGYPSAGGVWRLPLTRNQKVGPWRT